MSRLNLINFMSAAELGMKNLNQDFFHSIIRLVLARFARVSAKTIGIDMNLVIPNPNLTIADGAIAPLTCAKYSTYLRDLIQECKQ